MSVAKGMTGDEAYAILSRIIRNLQITGGGVTDYRDLTNKPYVNGVELTGRLSLEDLGIEEISNTQIDQIIKDIGGL